MMDKRGLNCGNVLDSDLLKIRGNKEISCCKTFYYCLHVYKTTEEISFWLEVK